MPRVGGVMQLLSGTLAVPNTTIQSAPYNAQQNDWVLDANAARPISAGGTGSTTASGARAALGAMGAGDLAAAATKAVAVDTDSVVIIDSQASNANKRWLVSAMKTTFGSASHDHARLVSTTHDISLRAGGTAGARAFFFNNKADGTGTNTAAIYESGAMSLASVDASGTITAGSTVEAVTTVSVRGSSNIHFWFHGPAREDRGVIFTTGGTADAIKLRPSGGTSFTFNIDGSFRSPDRVYAGADAFLDTNANLSGSIWAPWGSTSAFHAINAQIESRAKAWADNRVESLQYRKVSEGNSAAAETFRAPAGAVITGYHRDAGAGGEVRWLYYMYLQVYDPVRGWVGFTG